MSTTVDKISNASQSIRQLAEPHHLSACRPARFCLHL